MSSERTRTEVDLLGPKEVPADAYYGVHTVRAMENFRISGTTVSDVPEMVRGMVMVKKASALANRELRTIQRDVADAIVAACEAVTPGCTTGPREMPWGSVEVEVRTPENARVVMTAARPFVAGSDSARFLEGIGIEAPAP